MSKHTHSKKRGAHSRLLDSSPNNSTSPSIILSLGSCFSPQPCAGHFNLYERLGMRKSVTLSSWNFLQ